MAVSDGIACAGLHWLLAALWLANRGRTLAAFVASSLAMTGVIGTAGISMFPFVMPSSTDLRSSLTVWDSVSSHKTLGIMLVAVVIFMPIIIAYTRWAYGRDEWQGDCSLYP